jgi:hypothetical protein
MSALQKWFAGVIASAMILAVGITGASISSDAASTATTPTTTPIPSISDKEVEDQLTVSAEELSLATLPEGVLCTNDMFVPNSLTGVEPGNPAMLQFSTAVSTPVQATEPLAVRAEIFAERCGNPTLLDMDVKALATVVIQGKTLGERNPWMAEFLLMVDTQGLRQAFLVQKDGQEGLFVTAAYSQYASMMNYLLWYWVPSIEALPSLENWHVVDRPFGELPRAELNPVQESQLALTLAYTAKEGCPLARVGHNMLDKRFERFEPCPAPPPGAPVTTVVPGTTPGTPPSHSVPPTATTLPSGTTVPPPATTLPPGTTVPPTPTVPPTVPPTTLKPKDPSKDVNVNPLVPPQVRGPGTTPIGVNPGPATPVFDTPTGCNGPCPTVPRTTTAPPPPAPTTPATTNPVVPTTVGNSGDGQVGVTIPAGPPPSCPPDICG